MKMEIDGGAVTGGSSVEKWKSTEGKIYLEGNDIN